MTTVRGICAIAMAAVLAGFIPKVAHADGGIRMPSGAPVAYGQECASCHIAYPPGLLPASSWNRMMSSLDKHYGTDASLDVVTARAISTWLQANAASSRRLREEPPQDRITRAAWFERKHRKIEPSVWRLDSVRRASNCTACHGGAAQGVFSDHDLKMPAGLDGRQRRAWHD